MKESFFSNLYLISFTVSLGLSGLLWFLTFRYPKTRLFWGLLAAGWTVNTLSSILWSFFDAYMNGWLFYLVNSFYLLRYVFAGLALWLYPKAFKPLRLLEMFAVIAIAMLVLWFGFVGPLSARTGQPLSSVLVRVFFPLLDAGALYIAFRRWRNEKGNPLSTVIWWMVLSALAYGIANWGNFWVRTITPDADSLVIMLFWFLTDVFAILAAVGFLLSEIHARG